MRALGVDVGVSKGLDLVLLDDALEVLDTVRHASLVDLRSAIAYWHPDVIAIDSPPSFAVNGPRPTENAIRKLGLTLYATPWEEEKKTNPFYGWMLSGFAAFATASVAGYLLYTGGESVYGKAIEVFPYATAVVLAGGRKRRDIAKHAWRRGLLAERHVDTGSLHGPDQIDAALAAFTGLSGLQSRFCAPGCSSVGGIVLPCSEKELPSRYT